MNTASAFERKVRNDFIAEYVIEFIEELPVPKGMLVDQNIRLLNWQKEVIRALYGEPRPRQALISVPRKNGKTTFVAALILANLIGPLAEKGGEIYSAAPTHAQATMTYSLLKDWLENHFGYELWKRNSEVRAFGSTKSIYVTERNIQYFAKSGEYGNLHGLNPSAIFYDELGQAQNRDMWDVLATSMGARTNPLLLAISTQSEKDNHIMSELYDYATSVASGEIVDDAFYGYIQSAPLDADIWDEQVWLDCNPSMPTFRSLEEMRSFASQTKAKPDGIPRFRSLYLNQRVPYADGFIVPQDWNELAFEGDIGHNEPYLAIHADVVSGMAQILKFTPSNRYLTCEDTPLVELEEFLDNTYRNEGIARTFVDNRIVEALQLHTSWKLTKAFVSRNREGLMLDYLENQVLRQGIKHRGILDKEVREATKVTGKRLLSPGNPEVFTMAMLILSADKAEGFTSGDDWSEVDYLDANQRLAL